MNQLDAKNDAAVKALKEDDSRRCGSGRNGSGSGATGRAGPGRRSAPGRGRLMTVEHLIVGLLGVTLTAGVAFGLRLDAKIDRANDRIDDAAKDLKEDARVAHAEIGSNIRRVEETFNARFDDLRDYIKLALKAADKD